MRNLLKRFVDETGDWFLAAFLIVMMLAFVCFLIFMIVVAPFIIVPLAIIAFIGYACWSVQRD